MVLHQKKNINAQFGFAKNTEEAIMEVADKLPIKLADNLTTAKKASIESLIF
jgi:hypothetical protein